METEQEMKEFKENLSKVTRIPFPLWKRIVLLIIILSVTIGGYYLTGN